MGKPKFPQDDGGGGGGSEWLNTYADMVTLLLTFFILLYAMSSINPVKWSQLVQTFGNENQTVASVTGNEEDGEITTDMKVQDIMKKILEPSDSDEQSGISDEEPSDSAVQKIMFEHIYEILNQYIINNDLQQLVGLDKDENYVMIRFKDRAFFDSGKADLKSNSLEIVKFVCDAISLVIDQVDMIEIAGHTDTVPQKGSWMIPDNWSLSQARAYSVLTHFIEYGLPPEKLMPVGYGEYHPYPGNEGVTLEEKNDTEEKRSLNRRVEIVVTRTQIDIQSEDDYDDYFDELAEIEAQMEAETETHTESTEDVEDLTLPQLEDLDS